MAEGKSSRSVPPRSAWGTYKTRTDVDLRYEYRKIAGKSLEEVGEFLIDSPSRLHHLLYAPDEVFNYYYLAVSDYLTGDSYADDADVASCYLSAIKGRMAIRPETFKSNYPEIKLVLDTIADRQKFYAADGNIYDSFSARRDEIDKLYQVYQAKVSG